jgi:hypothetical protein
MDWQSYASIVYAVLKFLLLTVAQLIPKQSLCYLRESLFAQQLIYFLRMLGIASVKRTDTSAEAWQHEGFFGSVDGDEET